MQKANTSATYSLNASTSNEAQSKSQILLKSAIVSHQSGNFDEAKKIYQKAMLLNPNNPKAYYNLGLLYKSNRQYEKSIKCLEKAVQIDPNYIEALVNIGNVYKKLKKYNQAEKYYKKAVQCDGKNIAALTNLGLLYKHLAKYEEAQKIFSKMIQQEPQNPSNYNSLGVILKNNKKYDPAIKNLQKAIELNPQFADAYYNFGVLAASMNKFDEAEVYLKKADSLKANDLIILIVRAVNLNKLNKIDEAFQLLRNINHVIAKESFETIEKKTNIRKMSLKWIKASLDQLNSLAMLNKQKQRMSIQQQETLKEINNQFFGSFIDVEKKEGENEAAGQIKKKLEELQNQIKFQAKRVDNLEATVEQIKYDVSELKKQFEWDQQFDKLLQNQPKYAVYYRNLYSVICTSIQSYRAVKTGIVSGGEGMVTSKVGGFIKKISQVLGLVQKIPMVCHFCEVVIKIGEMYLGKQSNYVCSQIVASTNNLYSEKKLAKATSQTILYLSTQPEYIELFQKKEQKICYHKILAKLEKLKENVIDKNEKKLFATITQFGGHELTEQLNMAMGHSSEIIINLIKKQNIKQIQSAENPLLAAAQLWVKELKTIRVKILGGVLQENAGIFSIKASSYCKIIYGQKSEQTQTKKNDDSIRNWNQCQFTFQKSKKLEQIVFEIYDKALIRKDTLVGKGWIYDNLQKQKHYSVDLFSGNGEEIIGSLEVELS